MLDICLVTLALNTGQVSGQFYNKNIFKRFAANLKKNTFKIKKLHIISLKLVLAYRLKKLDF